MAARLPKLENASFWGLLGAWLLLKLRLLNASTNPPPVFCGCDMVGEGMPANEPEPPKEPEDACGAG